MKYFIKNYKTTVLGLFLLALAAGLQFFLFREKEFTSNEVVVGTGIIGIGLLLVPDSVISVLKALFKKKEDDQNKR